MDVMKQKIDKMAAEGGNTDPETTLRMQKQMQALFRKYDCNPIKGLILPVVQMPIFIGMFLGLRRMPEYYPAELSREGVLWFTDLTVADPYLALPVLSALSFVATIELTKDTMLANSPNPAQGKMFLNVFRGLGVVMVPATMGFPAVIFVYWMTNNLFSFFLTAAMQMKGVRKRLGIWDPPKPTPGPDSEGKGVVEYMKHVMSQREEAKDVEGEKERIKKLNMEVDKRKRVRKSLGRARRY